jgi:colanic acid/amylovoran biosynthesis protein
MQNWSKEEIQRYLGSYRSCHVTHSADESVRVGAASGGTSSQLAIDMLEQGMVDGVLVWTLVYGEDSPRTRPVIATTRSEILAARTSLYSSVSWPRDAMPLVQSFEGSLAVMTLPCDASYLRRKMDSDAALAAKIKVILTLFCGHNSEPALTELLVQKQGVEWKDVEDFSYRTGRWRGRLEMRTRDGREIELPTSSFTNYQNLHFFSEMKCLGCVDHFGYDADLSLGDIWSQGERGRAVKPTAVVVRTEVGQQVIESCAANLDREECDASAILDGNCRGMTFHYNITARAEAGRLLGVRIPDRLALPTRGIDRLVALVAVFNFRLSQRKGFARLLRRVPGLLIRIYLIAFKGLQQLGVLMYRPFPNDTKISIIGASLTGNRGAEAMLASTIGRLREALPDARFVVHSYLPEADGALCSDPRVEVTSSTPLALIFSHFAFSLLDRLARLVGLRWPRSLMPRSARELAESRVLLDLSGVSFCDGREKLLPFNILCQWPAMLFAVPVVKLSQGMGGFEGKLNRLASRLFLPRCEQIFARGAETRAFCEALGLADRLQQASDLAFLFRAEDRLVEENLELEAEVCAALDEQRERGAKILVMAVSSVVLGKCQRLGIDYVASMAEISESLLCRGFSVVLLANASRDGSTDLWNNDLPIIDAIAERIDDPLGQSRLFAVNRSLDTASLRAIMARSDIVLASRFHALIGALALGIPALVLGWGHKYREVLAQFDCEQMSVDYSKIDPAHVLARIDEIFEQRPALLSCIESHENEVRRSSQSQIDWLIDWLRPQAEPCTKD